MLNFLNHIKFVRGLHAFGVEIIYNTKDSFTVIATELISSKNGIETGRKYTNITIEELAKENSKKLPIYLSLNGKGIIHKKVKTHEKTTPQELLNQVLPNANLKEFYLQQSIISKSECWVSVVRKELIDGLIKQITTLNLFVIQIYLGPFILENVTTIIATNSLLTTTQEITLENNHINHIDGLGSVAGGEEYTIDGEQVNSHELIAFSSAFSHFIPSRNIVPINCEEIANIQQEHLYKNKYTVVGFSMILFFFIITITNVFISNSIESASNELQYQITSNQQYYDELAHLKTALATKEQFIQNSGVAKAAKISFYADQIALTVPNSIQLDRLFINPLTKRINKAEDIHFTYNSIKISGVVNRSIELNNWIKELKTYEWVNDINIISFIQDNLKTPGEFEITVNIKP